MSVVSWGHCQRPRTLRVAASSRALWGCAQPRMRPLWERLHQDLQMETASSISASKATRIAAVREPTGNTTTNFTTNSTNSTSISTTSTTCATAKTPGAPPLPPACTTAPPPHAPAATQLSLALIHWPGPPSPLTHMAPLHLQHTQRPRPCRHSGIRSRASGVQPRPLSMRAWILPPGAIPWTDRPGGRGCTGWGGG